MEEHKCEKLEVVTEYYRDYPAQVLAVYCGTCLTVFPEAMHLFQEREQRTWDAYGGQSPMVFVDPRVAWARERSYYTREEVDLVGSV